MITTPGGAPSVPPPGPEARGRRRYATAVAAYVQLVVGAPGACMASIGTFLPLLTRLWSDGDIPRRFELTGWTARVNWPVTEPLSDPYLGMLVLVSAATAVGGAQWRAVRREGSWAADTLFRLGTTGVCVAALGVWSALIAVQFSEFAGLVETMVIGSGAWLLLVGAALMFGSATAAAHLRRRTVFVVTLWPASGRRRVEKFLGPVDN